MSDLIQYKNLIAKARDYYNSKPLELQNVRNGKEIFDFVWCDGLNDEINLWTYWQGACVSNPDVMIIGQDFGACTDTENKDFFDECVNSRYKDRKYISEKYINRIINNKNNKTDNMLIKLTEECLGDCFSARIAGNEHLFMTNLCLGYRSIDKISGGDVSAYLKHDSIYIRELINIKKPRIVICLGMDTYISLLNAFVDDRNIIKDICEHFWHKLDLKDNYMDISLNDFSFRMYGMSHAGSNGAMNRKNNCSLPDKTNFTGIELMMEDWTEIGKYLSTLSKLLFNEDK